VQIGGGSGLRYRHGAGSLVGDYARSRLSLTQDAALGETPMPLSKSCHFMITSFSTMLILRAVERSFR
jgi:hypothetical protein